MIPGSVTGIGDSAFDECYYLQSVTIPNSVTNIGQGAFVQCTSLTSVTIGNGVTSIGDAALSSCSSLTNITIPDSVTSIGYNAFADCSGLTSVNIGNGVTSIGARAFGYDELISVYFRGNAPIVYAGGFQPDNNNVTVYYVLGTTGWSAFSATTGLPIQVWYGNAPEITTQPQSVVVNDYDTVSINVTAAGSKPLSYQWSLNGSNVAGATFNSLTIANVTQTNLGTYAVVVSNSFGTNTSSNAVLSMYPYIATPFTGAVTYWGQSSTLSVGAWGTGPLSYQWFDNGNAISGATNEALTLTTIQATNAGLYSVVVTSPLGSATNAPAQVIVEPAGVAVGFSPNLTISGVVGYSYIIQSTTNLADTNAWLTVTNLTLTQPVQLWVDTSVDALSPFYPTHFYQVLPGQ